MILDRPHDRVGAGMPAFQNPSLGHAHEYSATQHVQNRFSDPVPSTTSAHLTKRHKLRQ